MDVMLGLSPGLSVPAIVEQNPNLVAASEQLAFVGFEILCSSDVDCRRRAQLGLDGVFEEIISVHFITPGFGYVCCAAGFPPPSYIESGKIIPLAREGPWYSNGLG